MYNTVFDLDLVRNSYLKDMRFQSHRACMVGTNYKPNVEDGYNQENPMIYCGKYVEESEENFEHNMFNIGRK